VIIPAHNAAATLPRTLDALTRQAFPDDLEVIVVDDGSSDETAAIAESSAIGARVVRTPGGLGPGPARNVGVAESSGDVIAFLDSDCFPTPGWLAAGVRALDGADLVQGAVHADPAARRMPFDRTVWVTREAGLYECASLFVTRELYGRIGGFEDWLAAGMGKPLAEDAWFGWRARRAGATTAFAPDALVHHAVFPRALTAFLAERARAYYFPAIVRRMPELRRTMLFASVFLTRRSAAFDGALLAIGVTLASSSVVPLLATAPWGWMALRDALPWRRHAPRALLGGLLADFLTLGALVLGSLRNLSPVL
jgi:glycosyltransferase involved in cell wall biosynthesis